jgi:hypothetical protein
MTDLPRRLFETRKPRERILMAAFFWTFLLLLAGVIGGCARKSSGELGGARMEARQQKALIAERGRIESRLKQARDSIDPAKTVGALKLSSLVDEIARGASLSASIASPTRKPSGIFSTYTVRVSCRDASLDQLIGFAQEIRKRSPYLAMRRFKLSADARDPKKIGAEMEIESFELNQPLSK